MEKLKFCIFCGGPPNDKTKEHVLPQWLIELTGPRKRVVNFGVNLLTGQQPRFDWTSFVFPACDACNQRYARLEVTAKKIVEKLLEGIPVTGYEYIEFLDWLDKVRIGLWLGYWNNVLKSCGKLIFLRGHDLGSGFGPPTDFIDVEVVTKLDTQPTRFMGFQLRNDDNEPARRVMFDLLRDGFTNNFNVCLDYFLVPGKSNGIAIRVELTR